MKQLLISIWLLVLAIISNAQTISGDKVTIADSLSKARSTSFRDSLEKVFISKSVYPLIKSSKLSGVIPVSNADEKPDVLQHYKLLMEVTQGMKDSSGAKELNEAIAEVARLLNIHIAAGIPKENIDIIVVGHGRVLQSFYNNAAYKIKYKIDNPNIELFNELLAAGVKFIACGQSMSIWNINKEELFPWMKVALSAQTVLSNYQLKGYIYKKIELN